MAENREKANKDFFQKQTDSSRIKAAIISEYFPQYCLIISKKHQPKKLGYYDMFAGPGRYDDGKPSTPLLVAEKCYNNAFLRDNVWMVFNDMAYGDILKENFEESYPAGTFRNAPFFADRTFGECPSIDTFLTKNTMDGFYNECPALLFIDPFGYKHINTSILIKFLAYWGNEVFIFVNTKRLNAAFENEKFLDDLKVVFPKNFETIRNEKSLLEGPPERRHKFIIDNLGKEFRDVSGGRIYYTAFEFREEDQKTPSHYLLHVTKGAKGFELVKQVYSQFANVERNLDQSRADGYETYTFDPKADTSNPFFAMCNQEALQKNVDTLKQQLLSTFAGQTIKTEEIVKQHHVNGLFARSHYAMALRQLYADGKISVEFTDDKKHRMSVLLSETCYVTFKKQN